jgi:hypothetical protein
MPTATQRRNLEIATAGLDALERDLKALIAGDLAKLEEAFAAAGRRGPRDGGCRRGGGLLPQEHQGRERKRDNPRVHDRFFIDLADQDAEGRIVGRLLDEGSQAFGVTERIELPLIFHLQRNPPSSDCEYEIDLRLVAPRWQVGEVEVRDRA